MIRPILSPQDSLQFVQEFQLKGKANPQKLYCLAIDSESPKIFISYRRQGGAETARLISSHMQSQGFDVFLDVDRIRSEFFDDRLLETIETSGMPLKN